MSDQFSNEQRYYAASSAPTQFEAINVPTQHEVQNESRKRSAEELDPAGGVEKRATTSEPDRMSVVQYTTTQAPASMMKLLCPNKMVGAIIGRSGATLKQLKEITHTEIKLSQDNDFFPETSDRVISISGSPEYVNYAIACVLSKMFEISETDPTRSHLLVPSPATTDGSIPERRYLLRGLVPIAASGTIIGHGGSIIRNLSEATGTKVQLGDGQDLFHTKERILNVNTPSCEAAIRVFQDVFSKLLNDPANGTYTNTGVKYTSGPSPSGGAGRIPFPAGMSPYGMMPQQMMYGQYPLTTPGQYGGGRAPAGAISATGGYEGYTSSAGAAPVGMPVMPMIPTVTKVLSVPDTMVGVVVGRGGSVIKDLMMQSGAKISVSQKGDLIPGTNNRKITITGPQQQVDMAEYLVTNQLSKGGAGSGGGHHAASAALYQQAYSQY